jgi:hypothetical protein
MVVGAVTMAVSTGLFSGLLAELFVGAPRVRRPWVGGSDPPRTPNTGRLHQCWVDLFKARLRRRAGTLQMLLNTIKELCKLADRGDLSHLAPIDLVTRLNRVVSQVISPLKC